MSLFKKFYNINIKIWLFFISLLIISLSFFGIFKTFPLFSIFTVTIGNFDNNIKNDFNKTLYSFKNNSQLEDENISLKKKIIEQDIDIENYKSSLKDLDSLKSLSKVTTFKQNSLEAKTISTIFSDKTPISIEIDKGSKNGIKLGQVVINDTGSLIGNIQQVTLYTATIQPYYVEDFKLPIKSSTATTAVISGSLGNKIIGQNIGGGKIAINDLFFTSSLNDKVPSGIYVGKIDSLDMSDPAKFYLSTDIGNISNLFVFL